MELMRVVATSNIVGAFVSLSSGSAERFPRP
jgi:hypothetical protein